MRRTLILSAILVVGGAAHAQAQLTPDPTNGYTVAIYSVTATDPNVTPPIATPVVYPLAQVQCGLPRIPDPGVLNNPLHTRFDDPADVALPVASRRQCEATITTQVAALPVANGYKSAIRANSVSASSPFSAFSGNSFNRVPVAPPLVTGVLITP